MEKHNLVSQLKDLADEETNPFKKRAYLNASRIITEMEIIEFSNRNDFKDIPGIGEAINKKIMQFKESGYIKKWKEIKGPPSDL